MPRLRELRGDPGEPSSAILARVIAARERQRARLCASVFPPINAAMGAEDTRRFCVIEPAARPLLDQAYHRLGLSARALDRVTKVARTIADLQGSPEICVEHLAEAIQYRALDRRAGSEDRVSGAVS